MTVCDHCRKPRDVSFPVYPYSITVGHENRHDFPRLPATLQSVDLCEQCASLLCKSIAELLMQSANPPQEAKRR